MSLLKIAFPVIIVAIISIYSSVNATDLIQPEFESFSGKIVKLEPNSYEIHPIDDNGDTTLSPTFRSWWYAKIADIDTSKETNIRIIGEGWSGSRFAAPVYSYDQKTWSKFRHNEISSMIKTSIRNKAYYKYKISKKFDSRTIFIARHFPYTYSDLIKYLEKFKRDKWLRIDTIGSSPSGYPIMMLTVTNPDVTNEKKKSIWIHSRTHPSETSSSFIIEGLLDYLLSNQSDCNLTELVFKIVPMVNPDGVVAGLSRNNILGKNLEESWFRDELEPYFLDAKAAPEVQILRDAIAELEFKGPKVIAAINLHGFNPPFHLKPYPFIFSNFRDLDKYGEDGKSLWIKQSVFLKFLNEEYCTPITGRSNPKTTSTIEKKEFPESWWWVNYRDKVLALTLEATPEQYCPGGPNRDDEANRILGKALAMALAKYFNFAKSIEYGSALNYNKMEELFQYWESMESEENLK